MFYNPIQLPTDIINVEVGIFVSFSRKNDSMNLAKNLHTGGLYPGKTAEHS